MKKNELFKIRRGSTSEYSPNLDYGIEIRSSIDSSWSYVLYKRTVIVFSNEESVYSGGFRVYSEDYAYIWAYLESAPVFLREELYSLIEEIIKVSGFRYTFAVFDSESDKDDILEFKRRGYELFEGIDPVKLDQACGAKLIFDVSYRKELL